MCCRQVTSGIGIGSLAKKSAAVSSQTSPVSPQARLNTILCIFLRLHNHIFGAQNSLLSNFLVTYFTCFLLVQGIGRFLAVARTNHIHAITLLYSFLVFLCFHFIGPFQQFSHRVIISDLVFNVSYIVSFPHIKLCHYLFQCRLFLLH